MPDLSNPIPDQEAVADLPVGASPTTTTSRDEQARIPWREHLTPAIVGLIVVLVTIANQLVIPPLNRLLEANVCRDYYEKHDPSVIGPGGDIDESLCKGKSIQTKVAELIGLITTLGVACELIVTLPLGYLSDRYGRRAILFWNIGAQMSAYAWIVIVAIVQNHVYISRYFHKTFNINTIVASPLFYLLGGSTSVMSTNLFAIIADVAVNDVTRTELFGYIQSASQVAQLLGPILAAVTMEKNLYIPFWIGIVAFVLSFLSTALLVDTRHSAKTAAPMDTSGEAVNPTERDPLLTSEFENGNEESADFGFANLHNQTAKTKTSISELLRRTWDQIQHEYHDFAILFKKSKNAGLSLVAFLVTTLAKNSLNVLLQYVSKRYGWTIAKAAYLFSVKAGVNLLLFIAIIPLALTYFTRYRKASKISANVWGARVSLFLLAVGSTAIGLSSKIWVLIISFVVYDLGWGFNLFMLSVLTHVSFEILDEAHTGRIYSAVGFVETTGSLIGAPLLSSMWAVGINIGGWGLGLPFWVCGVLYSLVGIALWHLKF